MAKGPQMVNISLDMSGFEALRERLQDFDRTAAVALSLSLPRTGRAMADLARAAAAAEDERVARARAEAWLVTGVDWAKDSGQWLQALRDLTGPDDAPAAHQGPGRGIRLRD